MVSPAPTPPAATRDELKTTLMVGMEIHVELATRSKMWTSAPNLAHRDFFDAAPNTLLDPVVLGMPGTLPVLNRAAVEMAMSVGLALGCRIAADTKWDRKSYYYPDLPKNYQISQYDQPLCFDGAVDIPPDEDEDPGDDREGGFLGPASKRIGIIRAHLEEDAGKLLHEAPGGRKIDHSIVDLNRAGTPLLEIVTQPDFASAAQVIVFCEMLRDICRHLGVSAGIMQRGHMRFEPNINVKIEHEGRVHKTPIVEIKNLNSFRAVRAAIEHEHQRQVEDWLETGRVMASGAKSTRGWDDARMVTVLQREKEEAHDYRYFPDPDLVSVRIDEAWVGRVRDALPELPWARQHRYVEQLGLSREDARALLDEPATTRFFEAVLARGAPARRAASVLLNDGLKRANERGVTIGELGISARQVADICALAGADKIGSSAADQLFGLCCEGDEPAQQIAEAKGLLQVSDTGALEGYADQVLADPGNAKVVADIKGGKDKAVGALLGQVMRLSGGQANPKLVREILLAKVRS